VHKNMKQCTDVNNALNIYDRILQEPYKRRLIFTNCDKLNFIHRSLMATIVVVIVVISFSKY